MSSNRIQKILGTIVATASFAGMPACAHATPRVTQSGPQAASSAVYDLTRGNTESAADTSAETAKTGYSFKSKADSLAWARSKARAEKAGGFHLVVSLQDRHLWAVIGDDTVLSAPVAVAKGTTLRYGKRAWTDEERMIGAGFSGPWTELRGSYRLPPDLTPVIAEFAQLHLSGLDVTPSVPNDHPQQVGRYKPTVKRWVNTEQGESCGRRLGDEVVRLLRDNPDLAPSDVVFLANHREGLVAARIISEAGYEVMHTFGNTDAEKRERKLRFYGTSNGVKGCTVQSFKGWESRAVVMAVSGGEEPRRLLYVGLTRVKGDRTNRSAFVTVVNSDHGLRSFRERFERTA